MLERSTLESTLRGALRRFRVVAIVGPRQCGKTTLARRIARRGLADYFDLEDPVDQARLTTPHLTLSEIEGLIVMDEIQRQPELLELLRVLADRPRAKARFLVLGSASPDLVKGAAESLAGRVRIVEMGGFDLSEVGAERHAALWLRGGFPRSFLARSDAASLEWRNNFVKTFLERDLPQLGIAAPAATLRRFWAMVAHFHGQVWNAAEFARSLGGSEATARRYLEILTGAFVVRQLPPWFENIAKRQVKSPKVYLRDSGLLHALLNLRTRRHLHEHPKLGASWEGFVIEQVIALLKSPAAYFWATHGGAELDLLVMHDGRRTGFEVKYVDAPTLTKSMKIALEELGLDRLHVVYPGARSYRMAAKVEALAITELAAALGGRGEAGSRPRRQ